MDMIPPTYELRYGSYYLIQKTEKLGWINPDGERIISMCDQVAIAYDSKMGCIWRHGEVKNVTAWADDMRAKLSATENPIGQVDLIVFPRGYPVEEINKCLVNTQYIGFLHKEIVSKYGE